MHFALFSVKTSIISLNNINQLKLVKEVVCFLWSMNWDFKYYLDEARDLKD
jgi:hypothetical protein